MTHNTSRRGALSEKAIMAILGLFVVTLILAAAIAWDWYRSGVQQRVWARQGIAMTQWEVFIGVDPAQKSITIREVSAP